MLLGQTMGHNAATNITSENAKCAFAGVPRHAAKRSVLADSLSSTTDGVLAPSVHTPAQQSQRFIGHASGSGWPSRAHKQERVRVGRVHCVTEQYALAAEKEWNGKMDGMAAVQSRCRFSNAPKSKSFNESQSSPACDSDVERSRRMRIYIYTYGYVCMYDVVSCFQDYKQRMLVKVSCLQDCKLHKLIDACIVWSP